MHKKCYNKAHNILIVNQIISNIKNLKLLKKLVLEIQLVQILIITYNPK